MFILKLSIYAHCAPHLHLQAPTNTTECECIAQCTQWSIAIKSSEIIASFQQKTLKTYLVEIAFPHNFFSSFMLQ